MDASARLDRRLLVGADHELARMQQPALPAALIQIEHRPRLLQEGRVGGEDPGAVLPRLERVFSEPAGDRRRRRLADAALDDQPVQLSAREARERDALRARQLARERLHPRDLLRGENAADGQAVADHQDRPAAPRRSVSATTTPCAPSSRAGARSPRSSAPQRQAGRSSPATPRRAAPCSGQPSNAAPAPPPRSDRSRKDSSPWRPSSTPDTRSLQPIMCVLTAGSTKGPPYVYLAVLRCRRARVLNAARSRRRTHHTPDGQRFIAAASRGHAGRLKSRWP